MVEWEPGFVICETSLVRPHCLVTDSGSAVWEPGFVTCETSFGKTTLLNEGQWQRALFSERC